MRVSLVQFEKDSNILNEVAGLWGYLRPDQFLDHLTVITRELKGTCLWVEGVAAPSDQDPLNHIALPLSPHWLCSTAAAPARST